MTARRRLILVDAPPPAPDPDAPWTADAACRSHPDIDWFTRGVLKTARAIAICRTCPVQSLCAEAGAGERYGIWGGVQKDVQALRRSS